MHPFSLTLTFFLMTSPLYAAPPTTNTLTPPDAAKQSHEVKAPHGAARNDEYYWMRDDARKDQAMLAYLQAENAYTDAVMAPLKPLQETLYREIVGRIKQDDSSVPYRERGSALTSGSGIRSTFSMASGALSAQTRPPWRERIRRTFGRPLHLLVRQHEKRAQADRHQSGDEERQLNAKRMPHEAGVSPRPWRSSRR